MAPEIKRRFLVKELPDWLPRCPARRIEQGYLVAAEDFEVQLCRSEKKRLLTVKRCIGDVRDELELPISEVQEEVMWALTGSLRLTKTRHVVELDEHCVGVDEFDGPLGGLVVAEVGFDSEAESRRFEPPSWLGEEVTSDERYAGRSLAEAAASDPSP
jgi:adenylate cyclase